MRVRFAAIHRSASSSHQLRGASCFLCVFVCFVGDPHVFLITPSIPLPFSFELSALQQLIRTSARMNPRAPKSIFRTTAVVAFLCVLAFAPLAIAQAKKPKYTVKEVMQAIHKGQDNIGKRVVQGAASKDDLAKMAEYYESLPLNTPPRGQMGSWTEKTGKLVTASQALRTGKAGAADLYKNAANCKACHNEHKPEDKK